MQRERSEPLWIVDDLLNGSPLAIVTEKHAAIRADGQGTLQVGESSSGKLYGIGVMGNQPSNQEINQTTGHHALVWNPSLGEGGRVKLSNQPGQGRNATGGVGSHRAKEEKS